MQGVCEQCRCWSLGMAYHFLGSDETNMPCHHATKTSTIPYHIGLQLLSGCHSDNWDVDKGRVSAHTILVVDTFGRPDVFC